MGPLRVGSSLSERARLPAAWLVPVAALLIVYRSPRHVISAPTAFLGLLALGAVLLAAKRPERSLLLLIVLLPFHGLLLAKLYSWGAPASLVKHLASWKEIAWLGVIVAGVRNYLATGRRTDTLDRLALLFVGIVLLYALLPRTFSSIAPLSSSVRSLAFREDAGFVLLLLGARHAPLPAGFLRRAGNAALLAAVAVAAVGIFEAIDSAGWNRFVVYTDKYTLYQIQVLHSFPASFYDIRTYGHIGGAQIIRVGSVFLSPLSCGFYLVIGFALALERAIRGQVRPWVMPALVMIGAALLLTQTRSAILGGLIVALFAFHPVAGHRRNWRLQAAIVLAGLALVTVPVAIGSGFTHRVQTTTNAQDVSTAGHVAGFWEGVRAIGQLPFGAGLGTSAGTGQRFGRAADIPENNYLQVGGELGVAPMLVFVALTLALLGALRRAGRRHPDSLGAAILAGATGLAVGAWFLHTWSQIGVAWTMWGLAGISLNPSGRGALARPVPAAADQRGSRAPRARGGRLRGPGADHRRERRRRLHAAAAGDLRRPE